MTEAQFNAFIKSALRAKSMAWKPISLVKAGARLRRGVYKCDKCGDLISQKNGVVDHIIPVMPITGFDSWDNVIKRMFCEVDELQFICDKCHKIKTDYENNLRKSERCSGRGL